MGKRTDDHHSEMDNGAPRSSHAATDAVLAKGAYELNDIAAGMLNHRIAALVFLPWLCRYTQQVRDAARAEERDAILALPDLPEEAKAVIRAVVGRISAA
jgi:hypothetical protein